MKKMLQKVMSGFLVCAMLISCLTAVAFLSSAEGDDNTAFSVWDGETKDTSWYTDGDTETTEYTIDSAAKLAGLAELVNTKKGPVNPSGTQRSYFYGCTFYITVDIDLGGHEWTPIGKTNNLGFGGTLEGKKSGAEGASVIMKGMTIHATSINVGLVGSMGHGGIKNITLEGASVTTDSNTAASFAGYTRDAACVFENLKTDAVIVSGGEKYVGGIVAYSSVSGTTFKNCMFTGSITTSNAKACDIGGIIGCGNAATFQNCTVTGSITVNGENSYYIGGILGQPSGANSFYSCTVTGDITSKSKYSGGVKLGGIVGAVPGVGTTLEKCYVSSTITSEGKRTGGMIGCVEKNRPVTFTDCQFDGIVNGSSPQIGAFIGRYDTDDSSEAITFIRCLNTGLSKTTYSTGTSYVSWIGLAGNADKAYKGNLIFTDCASLSDTPILARADAGLTVYTVTINDKTETITASATDSLSELRVALITWENGEAVLPTAISGDAWTARAGMYPVLTSAKDVAPDTYGKADLSWFDGAPTIVSVSTYGELLGLARIYKLIDFSAIPVKAVPKELREHVSELFDADFAVRLAPPDSGEDDPGNDNPGNDQPGNDKPGDDNPGNDQPGNDKPGDDKPGNQTPSTPATTGTQETPSGSNGTNNGEGENNDAGCASAAVGILPVILVAAFGMAVAKKRKSE